MTAAQCRQGPTMRSARTAGAVKPSPAPTRDSSRHLMPDMRRDPAMGVTGMQIARKVVSMRPTRYAPIGHRISNRICRRKILCGQNSNSMTGHNNSSGRANGNRNISNKARHNSSISSSHGKNGSSENGNNRRRTRRMSARTEISRIHV